MSPYERNAQQELVLWKQKMQKPPSAFDRLSKSIQRRVNRFIPTKIRLGITTVIKQMTRVVLFGADKLTRQPTVGESLEQRELAVKSRIEFYKKTGAAEGGITGAGGILLGLADFPLLLALKVKLLFDVAALYGYSGNDYRERLYIMHIFQLAFSSPDHRKRFPAYAAVGYLQQNLP